MFDNYYYEEDPEMYDHSDYDENPESYEYFIEERLTEKVDEWEVDTSIWTKDKWLLVTESNKETLYCDLILKHEFHHGEENKVVVFGIDGAENGPDMTLNYISRDKILDEDLRNNDLIVKGTVDATYAVVENVIKHFDNTQINEDEFALYLANQVKRNNENIELNKEENTMADYDDPELREHLWQNEIMEKAEEINKQSDKFPQDEWIKTHPLFKEFIIHTFETSNSPSKILFGVGEGAQAFIELHNGHTGEKIEDEEGRNLSSCVFIDKFNDAKKIVENTIRHFDNNINFNHQDIFKYLKLQRKQLENQPEPVQVKTPEQSPVSDRQLETAPKTGNEYSKEDNMADVYDDLVKKDDNNLALNKENAMSEENESLEKDEFHLHQDDDERYSSTTIHHFKNMAVRFNIESDKKTETKLGFTRYPLPGESYDGKWYYYKINGGVDNAKEILEDTIKHFNNADVDRNDIDLYLNTKSDIKNNNPHLEIAKKTGYVQGVCESVLAFNNDENRKIMSEAAMTFLSKKLLSEMNVTKDMAQKFANPETYKALEQCVFAPKQEQHLEQTQSRGRGL